MCTQQSKVSACKLMGSVWIFTFIHCCQEEKLSCGFIHFIWLYFEPHYRKLKKKSSLKTFMAILKLCKQSEIIHDGSFATKLVINNTKNCERKHTYLERESFLLLEKLKHTLQLTDPLFDDTLKLCCCFRRESLWVTFFFQATVKIHEEPFKPHKTCKASPSKPTRFKNGRKP